MLTTCLRFAPPALLIAAFVHSPALAQQISIRTTGDGDFVNVSASTVMQVDPRIAWAVLTDYDHLATFIPDLTSSRVVSRDGNKVRVEQKGSVGFFFYREPINVTLELLEEPPRRITAKAIEGNIRALETRYDLQPTDSGLKVDYAGRFEPDFVIPPLIGMPIVSRLIERRFRAMVDEIQRRDAVARAAAKQPVK